MGAGMAEYIQALFIHSYIQLDLVKSSHQYFSSILFTVVLLKIEHPTC